MDLSRFEITGDRAYISLLSAQNVKLIKIRWMYIGVLTAVAAATALLTNQVDLAIRYAAIGAVALLINGIFFWLNRLLGGYITFQQALIFLQLLLDISVASVATYDQGGLAARTTILYAFPITAAGLLFSERVVYSTALLSGLGYIASSLAYGTFNERSLAFNELFIPLVFYPVLFLICAHLVVYLMKSNADETREKAYDSFLALLTHQLKRPASTAGSIIDQLEHGIPTSLEKRAHYVRMLKSENQNLLNLLNNLLETASFPNFNDKKETVDLSRLLQRVAYDTAEANARTESLKLNIHNTTLEVRGNGGRLTTALTNVLNNSFQYSAPSSTVRVSAEPSGDFVTMVIEDQGKGLTGNAKMKLFKKYTLHENQEYGVNGLGLGLYVAKKIIQAYEGSLHIVSNKGGTKVIIMLKKGDNNG